jgi:hypothetical protein
MLQQHVPFSLIETGSDLAPLRFRRGSQVKSHVGYLAK